MKKLLSLVLTIAIIVCAVPFGAFTLTASAATEYNEDYYTYTVENNQATITGVDTSISGDITIPSTLGGYKVTSIGYSAFGSCTNLTSIIIPDSVENIENDAFWFCARLTSVTIPDSVTSIGVTAFDSSYSLIEINVDENNKNYSSVDGVLFNKEKTALIRYPEGKTETSYIIPDSVTSIGGSAFYRCDSLTSITIPDSVTSIGNWAFSGCTGFTSITIPNGVTGIGECAFYNCTSLTSITIGNGVTSIGPSAFFSCRSLTSITIGNGVTSIGNWAFGGCDSLTSITIPDSVTSIGDDAFSYCDSLTSITIPNSVTSIGVYAFDCCESLESVYYTGSKEDKEKILINSGNDYLLNAAWHYNYGEKTYSDISLNEWYTDAVNYVSEKGIMTGYGGTNLFGTADNIQRQDFVVILARMAGVDLANYQSDRASFADVPSGAYYEKAILWAADCGITTGYNDGSNRFGVGDKITREQLVTFLYRYAKYQNGGISPEISNNAAEKAAAYPDFADVTDYAEEAIIWALDKGVISGKGGTHIAPAGNALRCEIAQIMYNIFLNDIF